MHISLASDTIVPDTMWLSRIEDFCASLDAAIIHDLRFQLVGGWSTIRALVDACERSGLAVLAARFESCVLEVTLAGEPTSAIASLWHDLAVVQEAALLEWQSRAIFDQVKLQRQDPNGSDGPPHRPHHPKRA